MDNLYDQLLALERIPGAYSGWAAYREAVTDFIIARTEQGASATILGAGALNDFAVERLIRHFSRLTLLDRDEESMREGLKRQEISGNAVRLYPADLLGISEDT